MKLNKEHLENYLKLMEEELATREKEFKEAEDIDEYAKMAMKVGASLGYCTLAKSILEGRFSK